MVLLEDPEIGPEKALLAFHPLSDDEVLKLVRQSAKKCCPLSPAPTSLVVSCLDVLLPVIACMINCSLTSEEFPDSWKEALVFPLLKKSGVLSKFANLRPVSNLSAVRFKINLRSNASAFDITWLIPSIPVSVP